MTRHNANRPQMILDVIAYAQSKRGAPPTVGEIGAAVGLSSPAAVHHHLQALVSAGRLRHSARRGYSIVPQEVTADAIELAWCLSVHGSRPPKVRPCKRHRLMAEWLAETVLPRARTLA